jgi:hypothetical protein
MEGVVGLLRYIIVDFPMIPFLYLIHAIATSNLLMNKEVMRTGWDSRLWFHGLVVAIVATEANNTMTSLLFSTKPIWYDQTDRYLLILLGFLLLRMPWFHSLFNSKHFLVVFFRSVSISIIKLRGFLAANNIALKSAGDSLTVVMIASLVCICAGTLVRDIDSVMRGKLSGETPQIATMTSAAMKNALVFGPMLYVLRSRPDHGFIIGCLIILDDQLGFIEPMLFPFLGRLFGDDMLKAAAEAAASHSERVISKKIESELAAEAAAVAALRKKNDTDGEEDQREKQAQKKKNEAGQEEEDGEKQRQREAQQNVEKEVVVSAAAGDDAGAGVGSVAAAAVTAVVAVNSSTDTVSESSTATPRTRSRNKAKKNKNE